MQKTITVKGIGRVAAKPDTVTIQMDLNTREKEYGKAMETASVRIQEITRALTGIGFEKDAVKTVNFNVRSDYRGVRDAKGNYREEFEGYTVQHTLKLEFSLDIKRLSQTLSAVTGCKAKPRLSVAFTVKDASAVQEALLRAAAENARKKAEILCAASGVALGGLLSVDYSWSELRLCSDTRYSVLQQEDVALPAAAERIDIEPDDIEVNDTATFVWELL